MLNNPAAVKNVCGGVAVQPRACRGGVLGDGTGASCTRYFAMAVSASALP